MVRGGGYFCGALRYRVRGPPIDVGYCHCRMCQRAMAAPAVPWGTWPTAGFAWLSGKPRTLSSSARGRRRFCPDCGTHLVFESLDQPGRVDVAIVTLDRPEALRPQYHSWTGSRIAWFDTTDPLPRFLDGGPDTEHGTD